MARVFAISVLMLTIAGLRVCSPYPVEYQLHDPAYLQQLANQERINSANYVNKVSDLEPFDNEKDTKTQVHLESEGIPSKILSAYDNTQNQISRVVNVSTSVNVNVNVAVDVPNYYNSPVIDNTKEENKYGNNGSLTGLAKGVIGVMEFISNFLNKVVEAPGNFISNAWESTRQQLNRVGGKVVGLRAYDQ